MDVKTTFLHWWLGGRNIHGTTRRIYRRKRPEKSGQLVAEESLWVEVGAQTVVHEVRRWYMKFDKFMLEHGYSSSRCNLDHCVYVRTLGDGRIIILALYVDDCWSAWREQWYASNLEAKRRSGEVFLYERFGVYKADSWYADIKRSESKDTHSFSIGVPRKDTREV